MPVRIMLALSKASTHPKPHNQWYPATPKSKETAKKAKE